MRMVVNVNSHMAIITWINIFFADHVPDNREAEVDKRIQIMPPANQPNTVFEIENQGIVNIEIENQGIVNILHFVTTILHKRIVYGAWSFVMIWKDFKLC